MTDQELLNKMVEHGAAVRVQGLVIPVAAVRVGDGVLAFAEFFAHDQHHIHRIDFATTEQIDGRDLSLLNGDGERVAYLAPFETWPGIDANEFLATLGLWRSQMNDEKHRRRFEDFFKWQTAIK